MFECKIVQQMRIANICRIRLSATASMAHAN